MDMMKFKDMDREKAIDLLIASVAAEEFALAEIIDAEADKVNFVVGMLKDSCHEPKEAPTIDELLEINEAVGNVLKKVIEKEILLDFKLESAIELMEMEKEKGNEGEE